MVKSKRVDIGQYVTTGTTLAKTFAIDYAELRLGLPEHKLHQINLPPLIPADTSPTKALPKVTISAQIGDTDYTWQGTLVRSEGVFDERSRVLFVVAQIDDPYGIETPRTQPLRIGTFVEASIEGRLMKDLVVLPRHILRSGNQIWVIDKDNLLQNRRIETLKTHSEFLLVSAGLKDNDLVSLSTINGSTPGTPIRVGSKTLTSNYLKPIEESEEMSLATKVQQQ